MSHSASAFLQEHVRSEKTWNLLLNTDRPGREPPLPSVSQWQSCSEPCKGKVTNLATESRRKSPGLELGKLTLNSSIAIKLSCYSTEVMPPP